MSINGFVDQHGQVQKYNYNELDNKPTNLNQFVNGPGFITGIADHSINEDKLTSVLSAKIENASFYSNTAIDNITHGNLNQKIKVNPFVIRTSSDLYGTIRVNRSTAVINQNGSITFTPVASTSITDGFWIEIANDTISSHKVYISVKGLSTTRPDFVKWRIFISQSGERYLTNNIEFTESNYSTVVNFTTLEAINIQLSFLEVGSQSNSSNTSFTIRSMQVIDLTEMFGAGLEPSLEEFEAVYGSGMPYTYRIPEIVEDLKDEKVLALSVINSIINNNNDQSIIYRGRLTDADDLHNLEHPGMYFVATDYGVPDNFPYENPGSAIVLVIKSSATNNHWGETHYVMGATSLWIERCTNGGTNWSGWKKITDSDELETRVKNNSISYQGILTSADDLHNLSYPGMYYVNISDPPINFPYTGSGGARLLVNKSSTTNNHLGETHFIMGSTSLLVERSLNENGTDWSGWKKITDSDELETRVKNNSISYQGILTSTDDLHNLSYPGMYYVNVSNPPINFPYTGTGTARILVNKSSTTNNHLGETHFIMGSTFLWVERSLNENGTNWSGWKRFNDAAEASNGSAYDFYPHKIVSGNMASFKDGESEIPVRKISVTIIPTQSGSGDPTPSNKRPINEGFTEVVVNHTGKNLLKVTYPSKTASGITATMKSDGTIDVSGTASATVFIPVAKLDKESGAIGNILSGCPSGGGSTTYELQLDVDGSYGGRDYGSGASITKCGNQNIVYICVRNGVTINETFRPMVRRSGDSSTWVKYKDHDFTIALPNDAGVVYGGILDITNGVLTITKAKVVLGSLTWNKGTVGNRGAYYYYATGLENVIRKPPTAAHAPDIICSDYKITSSNTIYNIETGDLISITAADAGYPGRVWIMDSRHVSGDYTGAQFKSLLQSAGAEMVYTLNTPVTYQLMPAEIRTIYQFNNIWADCGDIMVDYYANPDLYMTASETIPSGKFFMVGDTLYLSTASIASGAKIIVGTNCNKINFADALNVINA